MKNVALIIGLLLSFSSFANGAKSVSVSLDDLTGEFYNGDALRFATNFGKSLVVECNNAYGLIGLSDKNYVAYNRIKPAHRVSAEECVVVLDKLKKEEKTLTFNWEEGACGYFGCEYKTSYTVK